MTKPTENDHNVYVLGAGFSYDGGMPLVLSFLNKMRDSHEWLVGQGRTREADAVSSVLHYRLQAAAAAYRTRLDLENIEELFSLASASSTAKAAKDVTTAIAATLDYAAAMHKTQAIRLLVERKANWKPPQAWPGDGQDHSQFSSDVYMVPTYDFYLGMMTGKFQGPAAGMKNTFITFNYDLLVEEALQRWGVPFTYGLNGKTIGYGKGFTPPPPGADPVSVLKLHGSLNWATPGKRGLKMTLYGSYRDVHSQNLEPVLIPPTWRKVFGKQLGDVWNAAVDAISTATRIIVIGFSVPRTDVHFKYLVAAGLQNNNSLRRVLFVNPSSDPQIRKRVANVFRPEHLKSGAVEMVRATAGLFLLDGDQQERIGRRVAGHFQREGMAPTWMAP